MIKLHQSIEAAQALAHEAIANGGTNEDTDNAMPHLNKIKNKHSRNFDKRAIERAFWHTLSTLKRSNA